MTSGQYVPIEDAAQLRALLFQALAPELQEPFHHLEASRTPREWVQRQHEIPQKFADLVPYQRYPEGWSIAEPRCHCPACGAPLPRPEDDQNHPVALHIRGCGEPACAVVNEVLHWFGAVIRPEKFSDKAIQQALDAFKRVTTQSTKKWARDVPIASPE